VSVLDPLRSRASLGRPFISAHRGAAPPRAEATISSYERAVTSGADFVEFDVRSTADGVLVACHDQAVGGLRLAQHRYADLVSAGHELVRVEDVVELAAGRVRLHVDLKDRGTEESAIAILRAKSEPSEFVLTTLEDDVVSAVKRAHPDLCVGLSLGREKPAKLVRTRISELLPFGRVKRCGADFVAVHFRLAAFGVLRQAARREVPVFVWTVNEEEALNAALRDARITTVVTDLPELALRLASGSSVRLREDASA
jgi:glycerophosphoryl diester phosphodiesterase